MSLDIAHTIKKLFLFNDSAFPILSVFLPIEKSSALSQDFQDLVKKTLSKKQQKELWPDIAYIRAFLEAFEVHPRDKGLVLFSGGNKVWEVIRTPFPIESDIKIQHSPHIEPLLKELQTYQRFAVLVADRQKATFFTIYLDTLEKQEEITDDSVPQNVKGKGRQEPDGHIQAHIQDHLHRHLKLITNHLSRFIQNQQISGVIIGGHKELLHQISHHLPSHLQKKIVGEFIAEPDSSINTLVSKTKEIIGKLKQKNVEIVPLSPAI